MSAPLMPLPTTAETSPESGFFSDVGGAFRYESARGTPLGDRIFLR